MQKLRERGLIRLHFHGKFNIKVPDAIFVCKMPITNKKDFKISLNVTISNIPSPGLIVQC